MAGILSAQSYLLVDNEGRGNPHTTGQAAAVQKQLYTGTAKELPLYTQVTKKNN